MKKGFEIIVYAFIVFSAGSFFFPFIVLFSTLFFLVCVRKKKRSVTVNAPHVVASYWAGMLAWYYAAGAVET